MKLALIDYDHSLFMTEKFWEAAVEAVVRLFGDEYDITAGYLEAERSDRRPGSPGRVAGGEGYDLFAHLRDGYGINPQMARAKLIKELLGGSWLYPHAQELIQHLKLRGYKVLVVTVGVTDFQWFKLDCVPGFEKLLDGFLPIPYNKGYLAQYVCDGFADFPGDPVTKIVLVCDSPSTFEAVGDYRHLLGIQLVGRPKNPTATTAVWVHGITGLEQAPALIDAFEAEC
ncbi:MAG TPA: hypothetical protein VMS08_05155 [Candidatus Saccharimonadia bacterium]|nr:hypothetical protein [Candidatus Saccharimonadia bacterium]